MVGILLCFEDWEHENNILTITKLILNSDMHLDNGITYISELKIY